MQNQKRLGFFSLMFPKYNDINISFFPFVFTILLNCVLKYGKMIGGNFNTIDFENMVYKMLYGFILLS